jgi:dehydrogenase/reductase SDR family protein 12
MSDFGEIFRGLTFYVRFLGSFTSIGYNLRRMRWGNENFDLSNQVWLVTGAYGGIGSAIATNIIALGGEVIAVGRNRKKLAALANQVGSETSRIYQEVVDLSLQAEVHKLVEKLSAGDKKIDVVVNNVGILNNKFSQTAEGHETTYATNLLNHHLLTEGLIAGNALEEDARIINVSSGGLYNVPLNTDLLDQAESEYNGVMAYASHKRAQLALADHYQQEYAKQGFRFYAMHPGWVDTEGVQKSLPGFRAMLKNILRDSSEGADTIIWLGATAPTEAPGKIWFDRKPRPSHIFRSTRNSLTTTKDIVAYLNKDIALYKGRIAA